MEQLDYNILFQWFVGLAMDEPIWDPTVFSKNRDRLLNQDLARDFLRRVVERAAGYMSDEHFTVDGTLIKAWASQKSFSGRTDAPMATGVTFTANREPMTRMRRRPTRRRSSIGRDTVMRRGWRISAIS
jgi:hypothetical protein